MLVLLRPRQRLVCWTLSPSYKQPDISRQTLIHKNIHCNACFLLSTFINSTQLGRARNVVKVISNTMFQLFAYVISCELATAMLPLALSSSVATSACNFAKVLVWLALLLTHPKRHFPNNGGSSSEKNFGYCGIL